MKTAYSSDQYESNYPDGIEDYWWSAARSQIVVNAVNAFAGRESCVLEVGCGRGTVVKRLRDAEIQCYGVEVADVEPVAAVAPYVRAATDAVALPADERQRYDTILLLDVIEHIPEPVPFLRNLVDAFPNLSRVIITVPARQELWSNYDDFYGHYRRYTIATLDKLSRELDWTSKRKGYFFHSLYLPAWMMTKLKRNRETQVRAPSGLNRIIHRVIAYVMLADYYLLPSGLLGTSAIGCFYVGNGPHR